jgi:hypothetical protein
MQRRPVPLGLKLAAIPIVAAVVLVGIWVSGGAITNDFAVAMWLTVAWMALAGIACLAIAFRSPGLRWPVLGAYVVTAGVVGVYLGSSVFLDNEVNERVAVAAPPSKESGGSSRGDADRPRNVRLRAGRFESVAHSASGDAMIIDLARGGRVLTLTDFEVDNGPDLRIYLVAGPARSEDEVDDFVELGGLKGNKGNQQYEIPDRIDVERYSTAVIWCRAFSVLFARAPTVS